MKKIFIIDGNSLMNRAFYALPLLTNANGIYSNAVFGFLNCVIKLMSENKPDYFVVAFDHARHTFRNDLYNGYKTGRKETPTELKSQFPIVKEALDSMGIKYIEQEGIEADDIIGTITKKSGIENVIITGDRDSLQLINQNTKVWLTVRGITDINEITASNIKEIYGLTPSQIIDYKALAGDSSDNIPGVNGIGNKTAISMLENFEDVDGIYNNLHHFTPKTKEKLMIGKDICYLSKTLATIKTDCNINFNLEECAYPFPFGNKVKDFFNKYNFNAFLKRENIFSREALSNTDAELITTKADLDKILSEFDGNYFAIDFRSRFLFGFNGRSFLIEKEITLFDLSPLTIEDLIKSIMPIIKNEKVIKIISDVKAHMHLLNINYISNAFDIKLAKYLISGGNKIEDAVELKDYYQTYLTQKEEMERLNLSNLYEKIEMPLITVLYNMEKQGFKIDRQQLISLGNDYARELVVIEREILKYSINPNLNIKSAKQLSEFLFEELGLSDKGNKKHSTNVDVLTELMNAHPVIPLILRYRKVQKLHSTYIEPYLKLTENSEIIHTIFNQMQTSTGRLSSSEPNLQNIPVRDEEGKNLRRFFVSRFNGGKIVSADYNQIELRLLANFSEDETLVEDYNKGADIHRYTASQIFNKPTIDVTDKERRMAKAVNFGIIYGISGFGLAKNIETSVKEAQMYIDIYFSKYPKVKHYLDSLKEFAKNNGYVKTLYNRIRYIPEIVSNNAIQRVFGERVAMNMPLQGSASDIIKIAMIRVFNRLEELNLQSKLILQIHDELIVDTAPNEEQTVKQILQEEMESVFCNRVPLLVEVGSGYTWFDCK